MTAPDPAWVEAGAKALTAGKTYGGWIHDEDAWRAATGIAEKIIAAVAPLIRREALADLRAKVSSGWVPELDHEARIAVLALIDGADHE